MKKHFGLIWLAVFLAAAYLLLVWSREVSGEGLTVPPVTVSVSYPASPVLAEGKMRLLYEIHFTNYSSTDQNIIRIEVLGDPRSPAPIAVYQGSELASMISRVGNPSDSRDRRILGGGMSAVAFVELTVDTRFDLPPLLHHRVYFNTGSLEMGLNDTELLCGEVVVRRAAPPLVIGPPLKGSGWVALSALSNTNAHRRSLVVVDGKARIAQRFATDWTRIGTDGQVFHGDPSKNSNWSPYGAEILAVADGTIVNSHDGIPENDPTSDKKAVPINLDTVGGNFLIMDLGRGNYAFYAHLKPGSLRFKTGQKVRKGQVLAQLGNSGQSDAPHLHFHIGDANSPLGAEGVPYVFDAFSVLGMLSSKSVLTNGEGWLAGGITPSLRRREMPVENAIIEFK